MLVGSPTVVGSLSMFAGCAPSWLFGIAQLSPHSATIRSILYPLDFSGILGRGFEYIVHALHVGKILVCYGWFGMH